MSRYFAQGGTPEFKTRYLGFHQGNGVIDCWSKHHMKRLVSKFWNDESGATAIEYGLIAAGISLAIIAVVNGLGTNLNLKFTDINSSLK